MKRRQRRRHRTEQVDAPGTAEAIQEQRQDRARDEANQHEGPVAIEAAQRGRNYERDGAHQERAGMNLPKMDRGVAQQFACSMPRVAAEAEQIAQRMDCDQGRSTPTPNCNSPTRMVTVRARSM